MWNESDQIGFKEASNKNIGQFPKNTDLWNVLVEMARDTQNMTFLEVGTWNGQGSTLAIAEGLRTRNDNFVFYSLECNSEKWEHARKHYIADKQIHILNEVLVRPSLEKISKQFPEIMNKSSTTGYSHWATLDHTNSSQCELFWNRHDLPRIFDVIVLDGGEYTTWFEFLETKHRANIFILDDIHSPKCRDAHANLENDPEWIFTAELWDNGCSSVFKRKTRLL